MSVLNKIRVNGNTYDIADGTNIAEEFSTGKNYNKGDYVIHPDTGILYRFKRAKASGIWAASAVDQVKLANIVQSINDIIQEDDDGLLVTLG